MMAIYQMTHDHMSDRYIGCEILNVKINFGWKKP